MPDQPAPSQAASPHMAPAELEPVVAPAALRTMAGRSALELSLVALVEPQVNALGYELIRVRTSGGDQTVVQIMAERPDRTMNVDDCARVSRAVSEVFDEEDPISGEYTLEVSSPGIARPLTRARDFEDFQGHLIKVELAEALDGRKRFRGILDGLEDDHVMVAAEGDINDDGTEMVWGLPLEAISEARLVMNDALLAAHTPPDGIENQAAMENPGKPKKNRPKNTRPRK